MPFPCCGVPQFGYLELFIDVLALASAGWVASKYLLPNRTLSISSLMFVVLFGSIPIFGPAIFFHGNDRLPRAPVLPAGTEQSDPEGSSDLVGGVRSD